MKKLKSQSAINDNRFFIETVFLFDSKANKADFGNS